MAQQGILSLTIKDRQALYSAYMPFVEGGGLFVQSTKKFSLGEQGFRAQKTSAPRGGVCVCVCVCALRFRNLVERADLKFRNLERGDLRFRIFLRFKDRAVSNTP